MHIFKSILGRVKEVCINITGGWSYAHGAKSHARKVNLFGSGTYNRQL